ncbi:hypothetical protein [Halobacillus litoralis]|uniref:Uncharacterized protein n=1 Tax=Halobacillus litoralis TaxID=45668 RepID=A0A410MDR8_9BACI|nr:hypothetical protein [Halobacillus litoralis]QAS52872.1 hypothetical protein HLI_12035 [Halobacillus litoralis]
MLYAYISPFIILIAMFTAAFFVIDWLAKLFIYTFIVNLMCLPFFMLYKEEVSQRNTQSSPQEESNHVSKNTDSQ